MELGLWLPDAAGTIDPAKLAIGATPPRMLPTPPLSPDATTSNFSPLIKETLSSPHTASDDHVPTRRSTGVRLLSRISSDTDPTSRSSIAREDNGQNLWHDYVDFCGGTPSSTFGHAWKTSSSMRKRKLVRHNDYFMSQMRYRNELQFHPDPDAGPDANVVADSTSCSIWDAYMLRADVARNLNHFRRQQVRT